MTIKARFPSDRLDVTMQFAGQFTVRDTARIGLPTVTAWMLAGTLGAAVGLTLGLVLYVVRPGGDTLDVHLYHAVEQFLGVHASQWPAVEDVQQDCIVLDNGAAVALMEVSGCNLSMRTTEEQRAVVSGYADLFDTLNHSIEIHSRQEPYTLDPHLKQLERVDPGRKAVGLWEAYHDDCRSMETAGRAATRHIIAVRARDGDLDELNRRCRNLLDSCAGPDLILERLTGDDLRAAADQYDLGGATLGLRRYRGENLRNDMQRRVLYVDRYPEEMNPEWLADILATPGMVDVVQAVEPFDPGKAASYLERLKERASAETSARAASGHHGQLADLDRKEDDIDWLLHVLKTGRDSLLRYGVYIIVRGNTSEDVDETLDRVKTRLRRSLTTAREPVLRTHAAAKTESLFHGDTLDEKLVVPSTAAAIGFPYAHWNHVPATGSILGQATRTGLPVFLDRFNWNAPHTAFLGMTGGGKSYAVKLHLLRSLLIDDQLQVYIVDPKQEYQGLVMAFPDRVTRYTVEDRTRDNTEDLVEAVRTAYRSTTNEAGRGIVLVDEAHRLLNSPDGRAVLSTLVREARDTETGVTLVSQNASDFTDVKEGRDILKNAPARVFFRHLDVSESMRQFFHLSTSEAVDLRKLAPGSMAGQDFSEALVTVSGQLESRIRVEASDAEHRLIEAGELVQPVPEQSALQNVHIDAKNKQNLSQSGRDRRQAENEPPARENEASTLVRSYNLLIVGATFILLPGILLADALGLARTEDTVHLVAAPLLAAIAICLVLVLTSRDGAEEVE